MDSSLKKRCAGTSSFDDASIDTRLDPGGDTSNRVQGEHHNWNPMTIAKLQHATRGRQLFDVQGSSVRSQTMRIVSTTLRVCWISSSAIQSRWTSRARQRQSRGDFDRGDVVRSPRQRGARDARVAMNRLGGRSNSGEGGEIPPASELTATAQSNRSRRRASALQRSNLSTQ